MNQNNVLETLVIRLVAEDAGLEEALKGHIKDAEVAAEKISKSLDGMFTSGVKASQEFAQGVKEVTEESKDLDGTIRELSNQARIQRNLWAGRVTDDEAFRQSTEKLHREMRELADNTDLTSDQMKKLTGDMAYAQRGLDSVDNVASRGGLAWTARIGITDAFGDSLRTLGPAGDAAAGGLRLMQGAFSSLNGPLDLSNAGVRQLLKNIQGVTLALPALAAAGTVAAVAGLHRVATAAAGMASEMEVAMHRTGLSAEALQELQYAAQQAGVEAERFNTVTQRLLRRAADAEAGNKGLKDAFDSLGVSLTDVEGNMRSADDLLGQVADGLFRVENQADRVALAFKLMDTEGSQMLNFLSAGSEGIEDMRREARELGLVISGETIMSLREYGNQVDQLSRQFEVLKIEVAAGFLPVLQDQLMPFIESVVMPWLNSAANQVVEFAESFTDFGPAGVSFRQEMISNMRSVIEFGRTVGVVVQGAVGAFNVMASVGGAAGGFIAGLADQEYIDDRRAVLRAQIASLEAAVADGNKTADQLQGLVDTIEGLESDLANLRWESAMEGMEFGFDFFAENAGASFEGAMDLLETDIEGTIVGWLNHAFSGEPGRVVRDYSTTLGPALTTLGNDISTTLSTGVAAGIADGVLEGMASIPEQLAYSTQEALSAQEDLNTLLESRLAREAREIERLARLEAYRQAQETEHLANVRTWYEQHYADMDRRDAYANIGIATGVGQSTGMAEGNLLGIDQAAVANLAAYHAQQERVALANADIAESARLAQVAVGRMADQDLMRGTGQIADLRAAFEQLTDTRTPLERLRDELEAFGETSGAAAGAVQPMIDEIDRLAKGADEAVKVFAELNKVTGNRARPSSDGSRGAFAGDFEAMQEAARAAFDDVQGRMDEFFGRNASEFDQMRADVQAAFSAGTISALDFAEAMRDIDAAEASTNLVNALSDIETGLHSIGGAIGGSIGQLANNLGDAVGVARQFASGDVTGGIISGLTMIAGGISDMIAANGEWARSIDQLSDRYRNLSRETVDALAKSETETRWFLFIPYKVKVIDESATSEAIRVAQGFLGALETALMSSDFDADFELGLDRMIQQELINGFLMTDEVQAAIVAFTEAIESGDLVAARRAYEELSEATREQNELMREEFPELYDTGAIKDYENAIRDATRAAEDLRASVMDSELSRAFDTGAIGLESYARMLGVLNEESIKRSFTRQLDDLDRQIAEAIEDGADAGFIAALQDQKAALQSAYKEALEQGAHEAAESIRQLLGTNVDSLQGVMRDAFDNRAFDGFLKDWGAGITDITRQGLITGFLESSRMKSALDNIGQMITDAVIDGIVTESELKAIREAYEAVGKDAEAFWDILEELGLGFKDLNDNVNAVNDSLRNIPTVFKTTQAMWDATQGGFTPSLPGGAFNRAPSDSTQVQYTVAINAPIYGVDALETVIKDTLQDVHENERMTAYGRT